MKRIFPPSRPEFFFFLLLFLLGQRPKKSQELSRKEIRKTSEIPPRLPFEGKKNPPFRYKHASSFFEDDNYGKCKMLLRENNNQRREKGFLGFCNSFSLHHCQPATFSLYFLFPPLIPPLLHLAFGNLSSPVIEETTLLLFIVITLCIKLA